MKLSIDRPRLSDLPFRHEFVRGLNPRWRFYGSKERLEFLAGQVSLTNLDKCNRLDRRILHSDILVLICFGNDVFSDCDLLPFCQIRADNIEIEFPRLAPRISTL